MCKTLKVQVINNILVLICQGMSEPRFDLEYTTLDFGFSINPTYCFIFTSSPPLIVEHSKQKENLANYLLSQERLTYTVLMNTFSSLLLCLLFTTLSLGNSTADEKMMAATANGFDIVQSKGSKINQERFSDSADSKKSDISNKKLQGRKMLVNTAHDAKETMVVKDASSSSDAAKGTKSTASRNSGTNLLNTSKISSQQSNANAASSSRFEGSHGNPSETFESQKHHQATQAAGKFMNMMHKDYKGSDGKASSHRRPPINNDAPLDVDDSNELIHNSDVDFSTSTMMSNNQILDDYPRPAPKPRRKPPINNNLNP
ncbi:uncharacterized protein LOC113301755 isoform X2 [Papaver somniferum]|uniref:uncharacterized protein LOC113301755 isoform X2 n=1 Tax=Papaver somniferum TaxID=3469 RepID=UPI000E6FF2AA|nr:uncharacterized protein LOC113301755 isoform X2 [Papaver somniferum]